MTGRVDPERMEKLIGSVRGSVRLLWDLARQSESEFMADAHKQSSAKYNFIAAIEACIDMASHVISRRGLRSPEDYADTFRVLNETGVIDSAFASELEKMARFRNRLVHLYWDVDIGEIWKILQTRLDDFEKYVSALGVFVSDGR